ncbi:hypothetical protein VTN96DRAFT_6221 [Rasamsonia emersonii]
MDPVDPRALTGGDGRWRCNSPSRGSLSAQNGIAPRRAPSMSQPGWGRSHGKGPQPRCCGIATFTLALLHESPGSAYESGCRPPPGNVLTRTVPPAKPGSNADRWR